MVLLRRVVFLWVRNRGDNFTRIDASEIWLDIRGMSFSDHERRHYKRGTTVHVYFCSSNVSIYHTTPSTEDVRIWSRCTHLPPTKIKSMIIFTLYLTVFWSLDQWLILCLIKGEYFSQSISHKFFFIWLLLPYFL